MGCGQSVDERRSRVQKLSTTLRACSPPGCWSTGLGRSRQERVRHADCSHPPLSRTNGCYSNGPAAGKTICLVCMPQSIIRR